MNDGEEVIFWICSKDNCVRKWRVVRKNEFYHIGYYVDKIPDCSSFYAIYCSVFSLAEVIDAIYDYYCGFYCKDYISELVKESMCKL